MTTFKTPKGTTLPLLTLQGKDYLQVAHRVQWFREDKPDWSIETEIKVQADSALARAVIRDETTRIIATATKFENLKGFSDYIEKAETGAIGRALALCGYGTQFTTDLDEGSRLADSPVPRPAAQKKSPSVSTASTAATLPSPISKSPTAMSAPASSATSASPSGVATPDPGINCMVCGAAMKLSSAKTRYYCPNFKDTTQGEHSNILVSEVAEFKKRQDDYESDVPF